MRAMPDHADENDVPDHTVYAWWDEAAPVQVFVSHASEGSSGCAHQARAINAEVRLRQLEAVLREIADEPAVRDPLGSLPPDSEYVRAARAEQARQRRRARAVLEGGSDE